MSHLKLNIIATVCENMGIGYEGTLPWDIKDPDEHFTNITSNTEDSTKRNAVIMGRITWDSIRLQDRPLQHRLNIVLTRNIAKFQKKIALGVHAFNCFEAAMYFLETRKDVERTFVIGGGQVFKLGLDHINCDRLYLTYIVKEYDCDTYFPDYDPDSFREDLEEHANGEVATERGIEYFTKAFKKVF